MFLRTHEKAGPLTGLHRFRPVCALVTLTLIVAACESRALPNAQPSAEGLAREVLAALERRDEPRLHALALDAEEFHEHVWPSLPAAQPERNLPWTYVWSDLSQKSQAHLKRTLSTYGGTPYRLESIRFTGGATQYAEYRVHRETVLTVRDSSDARHELRLFGSLLEKDAHWKVFSYVIDD